MAKVINPSERTFEIKDLSCRKRKIGKIPPTHNIRYIKPKSKKRRGMSNWPTKKLLK